MEVRDIHFNFEPELVFDYTRSKPLTRILNSLSLLFPVGEKFFIESVRKNEALVKDQKLAEDIKTFYKQEGRHGREHRKLNKMLQEKGVDVAKLEQEALERLHKYGKGNSDDELLVTVALENLTELLGIVLPKVERIIFKDNQYCALYSYHAIEEQEHAHVARDIMIKYRNISKAKYAKYQVLAVKELIEQTIRNYRVIQKVENK